MRAKAANRFALMTLGIALALLYAAPARMNSAAIAAAPGQPIAGIQCERQEYGDFHIHAHLDIFVDSRPYAIPALIGILQSQKCLYWMHTHDDSGIIHIEAPRKRAFTVAQFLELWKATGAGAPERKEPPKIFVDGKGLNKRLDQVELEDHMEIAVVYGKEPGSIPSSYTFPKGA